MDTETLKDTASGGSEGWDGEALVGGLLDIGKAAVTGFFGVRSAQAASTGPAAILAYQQQQRTEQNADRGFNTDLLKYVIGAAMVAAILATLVKSG